MLLAVESPQAIGERIPCIRARGRLRRSHCPAAPPRSQTHARVQTSGQVWCGLLQVVALPFLQDKGEGGREGGQLALHNSSSSSDSSLAVSHVR